MMMKKISRQQERKSKNSLNVKRTPPWKVMITTTQIVKLVEMLMMKWKQKMNKKTMKTMIVTLFLFRSQWLTRGTIQKVPPYPHPPLHPVNGYPFKLRCNSTSCSISYFLMLPWVFLLHRLMRFIRDKGSLPWETLENNPTYSKYVCLDNASLFFITFCFLFLLSCSSWFLRSSLNIQIQFVQRKNVKRIIKTAGKDGVAQRKIIKRKLNVWLNSFGTSCMICFFTTIKLFYFKLFKK
jgi:hypothetical protein